MASAIRTTRQRKSMSSTGTDFSIPRPLRKKAEQYLAIQFAFMDCHVFKNKEIEKELFTLDREIILRTTADVGDVEAAA